METQGDCAMKQVSINSTLVKGAILELHFWVRLADLRTQDLTQVWYKLHQIMYVEVYAKPKTDGFVNPLPRFGFLVLLCLRQRVIIGL